MILSNFIKTILVTSLAQFSVQKSDANCQFPSSHATVLSEKEGLYLAGQCSRRNVDGVNSTWSPSKNEIAEMELNLCNFLRSKFPKIFNRLSNTYFQYSGFRLKNKCIIYINALDEDAIIDPITGSKESWKTQAISVCDGGDYFWGIEYDPTTKLFLNISFNGSA